MVRRDRGASMLGCLVSLVLTMVVLYYGAAFGRVWWRYWEILDRMKSAARFAQSETDAQILRRLQLDADEIGLPADAKRFRVLRTRGPMTISITTTYTEKVTLPLINRSFAFNPAVSQKF
ncbi:MAG: hypothetical protein ACKVZ0_00305 [Gemmatimonadales bacterium]